MSLALNRFGEAVEVTEQSPYDLSRVDKSIPNADYESVDVNFNPQKTFNQQAQNLIQETDWNRVREIAEGIQREQQLRNADVLEQYRFQIACEQGSKEITPTNVLLNKALDAGTFGPDFKQNEISNLVYRGNNTDPTRPYNSPLDYSGIVPGDRVGSEGTIPGSTPGRLDASNTPHGQMSGFGEHNPIRSALLKRSKPAGDWGMGMDKYERDSRISANASLQLASLNSRNRKAHARSSQHRVAPMGDFWSDLLEQGEAAIHQAVQTEGPKLISQVIGTSQPQPQTTQPVYVPQSGGVVPVQGTSLVQTSSSVDTKILIYAGIGLAGLIVLLAVLKR